MICRFAYNITVGFMSSSKCVSVVWLKFWGRLTSFPHFGHLMGEGKSLRSCCNERLGILGLRGGPTRTMSKE